MEQKTQSGYLLLADISGFTSYIAQTDLEHSQKAMAEVLQTIVDELDDVLLISKLEGDAVFAYTEGNNQPSGEQLLKLIDQTYLAFRTKIDALNSQRECPCTACAIIPMLDLKFMVHYGDFVIQQVAGIKDLLGSDVNLAHRLMKNHVAESTGWKGYALFTNEGLERMQTDKGSFVQQTESYEHLGDVQTYVMDMHTRYKN
jgi:hypothetical protein